jgi:hypothetical protein
MIVKNREEKMLTAEEMAVLSNINTGKDRKGGKTESGLTSIAIRGEGLLKEEGPFCLLKKGMTFLGHYFFENQTYLVYEYAIKKRNEAEFQPRLRDYCVHVICNNRQADDLEVKGFKFRSSYIYARTNLDKGAIAVCIFVGRELAHISWVALTREAKQFIDYIPFQIDFANNEACTGSALTFPKFRGSGLGAYGFFMKLEILRQMGIKIARCSVAANNIASQKSLAKFDPKIKSTGRYLRILWWHSWKEIPVFQAEYHYNSSPAHS